jgi:hypothetical protein
MEAEIRSEHSDQRFHEEKKVYMHQRSTIIGSRESSRNHLCYGSFSKIPKNTKERRSCNLRQMQATDQLGIKQTEPYRTNSQ